MEHSFDIEIARLYGIPAAVLLKNIQFWIEKNKANEKNFFDGFYWTYNSKKAFSDLFPYLTARQIDYALQKLIDDGLVVTGNYNKMAYDRTLWYAITKKGYSILQNCEMDSPKLENGNTENGEPIPYKKSNKKHRNKPNKEFVPPTLEEVEAYCKERNNSVDAKKFYDYFTASDWVDSKGKKVVSWKQKVITWENFSHDRPPNCGTSVQKKQTATDDFMAKLKSMYQQGS